MVRNSSDCCRAEKHKHPEKSTIYWKISRNFIKFELIFELIMDRQTLASSSSSTSGNSTNPPPPEDAWYNTYLKLSPQWQSIHTVIGFVLLFQLLPFVFRNFYFIFSRGEMNGYAELRGIGYIVHRCVHFGEFMGVCVCFG